MALHPILETLKPLVKGLSLALGPDCEVVLHDISNSEHTIVAIENGHISGRAVGAPASEYALEMLHHAKESEADRPYICNFLTRTADGKPIRSSTLYLRDQDGNIVGYLCINYDMTRAEIAKQLAKSLTAIDDEEAPETPSSLGADILEHNLQLIRNHARKPLHLCSKAENLELIRALDDEGFFLLKGAVESYAKEAGKTKYTIYLYLREVRKAKGLEGKS